jgi:hypothetical protein
MWKIMTVLSGVTICAAVSQGFMFGLWSNPLDRDLNLYVSPQGADSASGAQADPFRTVQAAIGELASDTSSEPDRATVWLSEGRYDLSSAVMIDSDTFSNHPPEQLDFRALPGHNVVFSGGVRLPADGFVFVTEEDPAWGRLKAAARGQVLSYDLAAAGITNYGTMERHGYTVKAETANGPMQLIVDGQVQQLARWPNDSTVQMDQIIDPGPVGATIQPGGTFSYAYSRPETWASLDDVWVTGIFGYSWEWSYNKVASVDPVSNTVSLAYGEASGMNQNWFPDFHHYENVLEELDIAGEYYIDREKGVLYYYPDTNFSNAVIEVTLLHEPMFHLNSVSNITFHGITFETSRREFILAERCEQIHISDCVFRNTLKEGIRFQAAKDCRVDNCTIHHVGSCGIRVSSWYFGFDEARVSGNVIENCLIHDTSQYERVYHLAIQFDGSSNVVRNCTIHSLPHGAIVFQGNDHLIENNEIHSVALEFSDFGAIYAHLGQYPHHRGTRIANNYIHHIGETLAGVQGIYLDGGTMGVTIEQNLFHAIGGVNSHNAAISLNTASDAAVQSNLYVDCKVPVQYSFTLADVSTNTFNSCITAWYDQRSDLATDLTLRNSWYGRYPVLENFYNRIEEVDAGNGTNFPIHPCFVSENVQLVSDTPLPGSILHPAKERWRDRLPDAVTETANTIALEENQVVIDNDRIVEIVRGAGAPALLELFTPEWFGNVGCTLE